MNSQEHGFCTFSQRTATNLDESNLVHESVVHTIKTTMTEALALDLSIGTLENLHRFFLSWLRVVFSCNYVINAPSILMQKGIYGNELCLTWNRGDRSLELTFFENTIEYGATAFTKVDRRLVYQEGIFDQSESGIMKLIEWLAGQN